ncbi:CbtB-domain containing protein [Bradyrhizobium sp. CCGUVB4N]|uniref:CbtB domain-containing protein n=1 Tax=Bradyrhizobium sp. CCGUVB4N TaxID=2949631 RepID=UPI0020B307C0|nr:CbtB domain-containing protein [Bradyrhizobium sp. CCGUVB4N]MCP3383439.1 CbtB-domain containing protein [Bradyrhizobium sp. CCGUVB4N]
MSPSQLTTAQLANAQTTLPVAAGQVGRLSQALMAMVLGVFVVGMVGFSHIDVVHNAAHDVRHSNAFPCH